MMQIFSRHRLSGKGGADYHRRKQLIGKMLDRRYRILDFLGEGGFSHTYIAEDTRRPKNPGYPKCVVKHLRKSSSNPNFLHNARRLFGTEAETLERLGEHSQIPRLLAYFEERGEFYLVQEYLEGHSLGTELQPGRCWSEPRVYAFLREMLEILAFVNGEGVIHRDVKPDNIIRRYSDRKLCLVDFGTVKQAVTAAATSNSQRQTVTTGTPGYIPLEQWQGNPQLNSDLYALGIVAAQALTGFEPERFQGNPERVLRQHHPPISEALLAIICKMVQADWQDRYQSAQEVLQALIPLVDQFTSDPVTPDLLLEPETLSDLSASGLSVSDLSVDFPDLSDDSPETIMPIDSMILRDRGATSIAATNLDIPGTNLDTPGMNEPAVTVVGGQFLPGNETRVESDSTTPFNTPFNKAVTTQTTVVSPAAVPAVVPSPATQLKWPLVVAAAVGLGAIAAGVFWVVLPQQALQAASQTLQQAKDQLQAHDYDDCVSVANQVPAKFDALKSEAKALSEGCAALKQADQLARKDDWQMAIAKLAALPANSPASAQASLLMKEWGDRLIQEATEKYRKGDFKGAIALLQGLPDALKAKAKSKVDQWNTNQESLQNAEAEKQAGNWQGVLNALKKIDLSDSESLKQKVDELSKEAKSNLEARRNVPPPAVEPAYQSSPSYIPPTPSNRSFSTPAPPRPSAPPQKSGVCAPRAGVFDGC